VICHLSIRRPSDLLADDVIDLVSDEEAGPGHTAPKSGHGVDVRKRPAAHSYTDPAKGTISLATPTRRSHKSKGDVIDLSSDDEVSASRSVVGAAHQAALYKRSASPEELSSDALARTAVRQAKRRRTLPMQGIAPPKRSGQAIQVRSTRLSHMNNI
jgi:hypothetical protein